MRETELAALTTADLRQQAQAARAGGDGVRAAQLDWELAARIIHGPHRGDARRQLGRRRTPLRDHGLHQPPGVAFGYLNIQNPFLAPARFGPFCVTQVPL